MPFSLRRLLHSLAPLLVAGCQNVAPAGPTFASEPSGARVHVDGRDSGWVTPCQIALDEGHDHRVTLAMDGYEPREFQLVPVKRRWMIEWTRGVNGVKSTIRFPVLLPPDDLLLPIRESRALVPGRVFVRLRPIAAP